MEYGLIGKKLGHSFSKTIHERIGNYDYEMKELNENEFISFMNKKEFKGINVTLPYKEKVIPYLNHVSSTAKRINAVNVVINKNGLLYGYNTDYDGFKAMINYNHIQIKDKVVLILGTGGTSKTTTAVIQDLGVKKIIYASSSFKEGSITYQEISSYYDEVEVIINTTPKEMYPNNDQEIISLDNFSSLEAVIDVIYNPLKTNLILKAEQKKIKSCNGLYMLVAQAIFARELFIDKKVDDNLIKKVYEELRLKKENIVLLGMPSSGKSTLGKILAKKLNRDFIDLDEEIVKRINMDIATYFKLYGEKSFREVETSVVKEFAKISGLVIATGGGVILKKENINFLKQNGNLYFIDRDLDNLIATNSRPLSSNKDDLKAMFTCRYPFYLEYADYALKNNGTIEEAIEKLVRLSERR